MAADDMLYASSLGAKVGVEVEVANYVQPLRMERKEGKAHKNSDNVTDAKNCDAVDANLFFWLKTLPNFP